MHKYAPLLLALQALTGCYSHERYLLDTATLAGAQRLSAADRSRAILPAHRVENDKAVHVRLSTLQLDQAKPFDNTHVAVPSHTLNKMVTAGSIMTWTGSAISVAGTIAFAIFGGNIHHQDALTAGLVALSAEPIMLTGTVLWILGQTSHRPEETKLGNPDLLYLNPPAQISNLSAHTAQVSLRF